MASGNGGSAKDFYEDEKHLMKLCDFLRSSEGPPVREAVEMDKRVYYIKGAWIAARVSDESLICPTLELMCVSFFSLSSSASAYSFISLFINAH